MIYTDTFKDAYIQINSTEQLSFFDPPKKPYTHPDVLLEGAVAQTLKSTLRSIVTGKSIKDLTPLERSAITHLFIRVEDNPHELAGEIVSLIE